MRIVSIVLLATAALVAISGIAMLAIGLSPSRDPHDGALVTFPAVFVILVAIVIGVAGLAIPRTTHDRR